MFFVVVKFPLKLFIHLLPMDVLTTQRQELLEPDEVRWDETYDVRQYTKPRHVISYLSLILKSFF